MLNKTIEIGLLFDFYGNLLTDKQQNIVRQYYYQDLSLAEIATNAGISRQGVYDHLKRSEESLRDYEDKLGLVHKYNLLRREIDRLEELLKQGLLDDENLLDQLKRQLLIIRKTL